MLGSSCVVPGGQQTIYIAVGGEASISYNTHYSDGNLGGDYGGVAVGATNGSGVYRGGWAVSTRAPLGAATVDAGMSMNGQVSTAPGVSFTVGAQCR